MSISQKTYDAYRANVASYVADLRAEVSAVTAENEKLKGLIEKWATTGDWHREPLKEDPEIHAAFPTRSGRHDLYGEAMRLVGARTSKADLVSLVNWLLNRLAARAKGEP